MRLFEASCGMAYLQNSYKKRKSCPNVSYKRDPHAPSARLDQARWTAEAGRIHNKQRLPLVLVPNSRHWVSLLIALQLGPLIAAIAYIKD